MIIYITTPDASTPGNGDDQMRAAAEVCTQRLTFIIPGGGAEVRRGFIDCCCLKHDTGHWQGEQTLVNESQASNSYLRKPCSEAVSSDNKLRAKAAPYTSTRQLLVVISKY